MAKILIIEDDRQFRAMLRQMLERADHEVIEAGTGDEGLECFRQEAPDLLILDMMTPGRDGLEVLEEIRQESPTLKVIAISGGLKGDTSWLEPLAHRLGVRSFMHKPFNKDELLETVMAAMEE